jgi:hypothetical protein
MKFTDEPTSIEVRFEADGTVHPRRFTWNQTQLQVSGVGRQWEDESGRHVLVMAEGHYTFELLLQRETLVWRVVRAPAGGIAA